MAAGGMHGVCEQQSLTWHAQGYAAYELYYRPLFRAEDGIEQRTVT